MNLSSNLILLVLMFAYILYRYLRGRAQKAAVRTLLLENPVIIDVRSEEEFQNARNPQSLNIPLVSISEETLRHIPRDRPLILCCASGMRSAVAVPLVKSLGYPKVLNAGPWKNTLNKTQGPPV